MERKVFSDTFIAATMNRDFINIKVDREERPDLDRLYMTATQLMTGRGGWPNSVFLTPDLRPFFAGTYFPPVDHPGRPGFPRVLSALQEAWIDRRDEVEAIATRLHSEIESVQAGLRGGDPPDSTLVMAAVSGIHERFDEVNGGFGRAPKFSPAIDLELLLDEIETHGDSTSARMVTVTLDAMAAGGLRDHVGGGFHRYATDARWRVPHFEKMLYNQAQLAVVYARAAVLLGPSRWRDVARQTLDFVAAELTSADGAFFTALDAEVDGVEGSFYTWTSGQIEDALGSSAAAQLLRYYDLEAVPEGEGGFALFQRDESVATAADSTPLAEALRALYSARAVRQRPRLDDKILTSWNGMMIAAASDVGRLLGDDEAIDMARAAADFAWARLRRDEGRLWRSLRGGSAYQHAFLEDYAHLAHGLQALFEATGDSLWSERAGELVRVATQDFGDAVSGGFYNTTAAEDLIVRSNSAVDGALPSANAVLAHVFLRSANRPASLHQAWGTLAAFGDGMRQSPGAYTHLLAAAGKALRAGSAPSLDSAVGPTARGSPLSAANADLVDAEILTTVPDRPLAGEPFEIVVRLQIADGWHINAHPATTGLIPTTLHLELAAGELAVEVVTYPDGEDHVIAELGDTLSVWSGTVELRTRGTATRAGRDTLIARIDFQACDDRRCLLPTQITRVAELIID